MANKNIKIFVSCHKPSIVPKSEILTPIQVGTALAKNKISNMLYDNEGDNISTKNKMYCELTAQYWAWKNIQADYYGFFHYRRYLSFAPVKYKANFEGVVCDRLDEQSIEKYGLNEESMRDIIEKYDVIAPNEVFVGNLYWQYHAPTTQNKKDLDFCLNYIYNKYPEMAKFVKKALKSRKNYICNMFIMRKEIFYKYCEWLFDILFTHEKECRLEHYDVQSYRVSGYLAERLCGIYLKWLKAQKEIKFKELQRILINKTDDSDNISFDNETCPILININNKNWHNGMVLINSIINHSDKNNKYAIIVNDYEMKDWQRKYITRINKQQNIIIKIVKNGKLKDVSDYKNIANELKSLNKIITISTNCVLNADIYDLFRIKTNASINGSLDMHNIVKFGKMKLEKQEGMLENKKPYEQLSTDLFVLDLLEIRKGYKKYETLPNEWCVEIDEKMRLDEKLYAFAPHYIYNNYMAAKKNPKLVAYHGKLTPINNSTIELANIYWGNINLAGLSEECQRYLNKHYRRNSRSLYDALFPLGTMRRMFCKTYIRKY